MTTAADFSDDLALALDLADVADAISFERFGAADLHVEAKPDTTLVSDADTAVEQALRERITQQRPDDEIWGEEFGMTAGSARRRWVLDPIDGTHNYVRGVPVWGTLIGLLDGDDPVMGVVSAPALGRRWWGARGSGAFASLFGGEPRRIRVSGVRDIENASFSYSGFGGAYEGWGDRFDAFVAFNNRVWRSRGYGDFWSYLLVAEGAVDAAAEPELNLWDMAALAPIVTEAGGRFTGLDGVPGVMQGSALATNGPLHDTVLQALAPSPSPFAASTPAAPTPPVAG